MCRKYSLLIFVVLICLCVNAQAAVVYFNSPGNVPTPGPIDPNNLIGSSGTIGGTGIDVNNVGGVEGGIYDNDWCTYVAMDRGSQGQFFLTPDDEPVYQITGFWLRHALYGVTSTWHNLSVGGIWDMRVVDPAFAGTDLFVLRQETYTITQTEPNIFNPGSTQNDSGTGAWVHVVFDEPIVVAPGKTYGFDMLNRFLGDGQPVAFWETDGRKGDAPEPNNVYPDGTAFVTGSGGSFATTYDEANGDRVFIVELIDQPPLKASIPFPVDNADDASQSVTLSWVAGLYAAEHHVYFGTDFDDVNEGTGDTDKGIVTEESYNPGGLTPTETYYWRIDEVNDPCVWTGDVWAFTVTPAKAWAPSPYDNEICVFYDPCTVLSWNRGELASQSKLYFGTTSGSLDYETTIDHDGNDRYSFDKTGLITDTDYYWRVDEVNGPNSWAGDEWHFKTIPIISPSDPNLVGWWKFDEGPGKAIDWSGLNQHGTVYGGASSGSGMLQGALEFDGLDDYVDLPIGNEVNSMNDVTIATWVNFSNEGGGWQRIFDFGNDTNEYMFLSPRIGTGGVMRFAISTTSWNDEDIVDAPTTLASGWHHVAVMIDSGTIPYTLKLYLDGAEVGENITGDVLPVDLGVTTQNYLGRSQYGADAYFMGSLDDFRIYNKILTEQELRQLVSPPWAWIPNPPDNATDVKSIPKPIFSWLPGQYADKHDVYFGTDFNDVNDATRDVNLGVLVSENQDACSYDPPVIDFNTTYYWRVDEVNMSFDPNMFRGNVWSFTTANYIVIDNFDQYSGRDELRAVWNDGYSSFLNGSNVTASRVIDSRYPAGHQAPGSIHEGVDALQFVYDNDKDIWIYVPGLGAYNYSVAYYYSEMEATIDDLECVSDWTTEGVKMLSLQFSGDPDNDIGTYEQMYIALEDGGGDLALVKYGDSNGEDANNLLSREWTEWAIDLQEFETANANFDINDVNKVYIGLGERLNNHTAGGSGVVYIDSIRLDWAKCVPVFAPAGDLSGDCTIDLFDFIQLIDSLGAQPSTAIPIIDLKADNYSAGTWLNTDGSLGGKFDVNFFDINDMPTYETVDGLPVVTFDGNDYLVSDFNAPGGITGANDFTVINKVFNPSISDEEMIITWARRGGPAGTTSGTGYGTNMAYGAVVHWNEGGEEPDMGFDGGVPAADMWHEIAVTYSGITEKVLVNGKLNAAEGSKILDVYADDPVVVGAGYSWDFNDVNDANDPPDFINTTLHLSASVNRIRVYDESMSQAQLEYIITGSYSADLNGDGEVDFKDLAMLLDEWLKQKLFP